MVKVQDVDRNGNDVITLEDCIAFCGLTGGIALHQGNSDRPMSPSKTGPYGAIPIRHRFGLTSLPILLHLHRYDFRGKLHLIANVIAVIGGPRDQT